MTRTILVILAWLILGTTTALAQGENTTSPPPSSSAPSQPPQSSNPSQPPSSPQPPPEVIERTEEVVQPHQVNIDEKFEFNIQGIVSPRIFGQLVGDLFRYISDDSAKALNAEGIGQGGNGVAVALSDQLSRWAPRSGHMFNKNNLTNLATSLSAIVLIIFTLAFVIAIAEFALGFLRGASISLSVAIDEIIALCIIVVVTYSSFTLVESIYVVINQAIATICGVPPEQVQLVTSNNSGQPIWFLKGFGSCDKGRQMASSLMPDMRTRATMDSFTVFIFVLSSVLAASFAYLGQLIRILLGSLLIVIAPIAIALESIRFTRGTARGFIGAVFIYTLSLLGSGLLLSVYENIAGENGLLATTLPNSTLIARSLGTTAILFVTLVISFAGLFAIMPLLLSLGTISLRGFRLGLGYLAGAFAPQISNLAGGGGGGSGPGSQYNPPPPPPPPPSSPPRPGGTGPTRPSPQPPQPATQPAPATNAANGVAGLALKAALTALGIQQLSKLARQTISSLASGNLVVQSETRETIPIDTATGLASMQYASQIVQLLGNQRDRFLKQYHPNDSGQALANFATQLAQAFAKTRKTQSKTSSQHHSPKQPAPPSVTEQANSLIADFIGQIDDSPQTSKDTAQSMTLRGGTPLFQPAVNNDYHGAGKSQLDRPAETQRPAQSTAAVAAADHFFDFFSSHGNAHGGGRSDGQATAVQHADNQMVFGKPADAAPYSRTRSYISGYHGMDAHNAAHNGHTSPGYVTTIHHNGTSDNPSARPIAESPDRSYSGHPSAPPRQRHYDEYRPAHDHHPAYGSAFHRTTLDDFVAYHAATWRDPQWQDQQVWGPMTPYLAHQTIAINRAFTRLNQSPPDLERLAQKVIEIRQTAGDEAVEQIGEVLSNSRNIDEARERAPSHLKFLIENLISFLSRKIEDNLT